MTATADELWAALWECLQATGADTSAYTDDVWTKAGRAGGLKEFKRHGTPAEVVAAVEAMDDHMALLCWLLIARCARTTRCRGDEFQNATMGLVVAAERLKQLLTDFESCGTPIAGGVRSPTSALPAHPASATARKLQRLGHQGRSDRPLGPSS